MSRADYSSDNKYYASEEYIKKLHSRSEYTINNCGNIQGNDIFTLICALPVCEKDDCLTYTDIETFNKLEKLLKNKSIDVDDMGDSDKNKHYNKSGLYKATTPLIFSIIQDKSYLTELLIENDANVDLPDNSGMTPLIKSVLVDKKECFNLLLEKNANVNLKDTKTEMTPLIASAQMNKPEYVTLLVNKHADINAQDSEGKTALMRAAQYGSTACFDFLLPISDITIKDNEGNTVKNLISKDCKTCFDKLAQSICSNTSIVEKLTHTQSDSLSKKERAAKEEQAKEERNKKLNAGSKKRKYKLHKKKTSKKTRSLKKKQTKKRCSSKQTRSKK
jgi:hypothetical protein